MGLQQDLRKTGLQHIQADVRQFGIDMVLHIPDRVEGFLQVWGASNLQLLPAPFGQDLSRGAQDTTCDQMDEPNSTSQHFDPVSKFSVYNLNPPEIIGVSCPVYAIASDLIVLSGQGGLMIVTVQVPRSLFVF